MSLYSILCGSSGTPSGNGNGSSASGGAGSSGGSGGGSSGGGYINTPQAWVAPESFEVEGTTFTYHASPYNPDDVGIIPRAQNQNDSDEEIKKQLPPSFYYEGPVGGGGALGLLPAKPGSPAHDAYLAAKGKRDEKEKYNAKNVGTESLVNNEKSTDIEIDKQTGDPGFWERFNNAVRDGYEKDPEGTNYIQIVIDALNGLIGGSNYPLLFIAGGLLFLILIIR